MGYHGSCFSDGYREGTDGGVDDDGRLKGRTEDESKWSEVICVRTGKLNGEPTAVGKDGKKAG